MKKDKSLEGQMGLFDGPESIANLPIVYIPEQMAAIYNIMVDSVWRTVKELIHFTGFKKHSISAQLRNLRKSIYGSHKVEVRLRGLDLYEYKLYKNLDIRIKSSPAVNKIIC